MTEIEDAAVRELVEWWEDVHDRDFGSRAVLLAVPPRWGRTFTLDRFADHVDEDESRLGIVVRVSGNSPTANPVDQVAAIIRSIDGALKSGRVATILGANRLGEVAQNILGFVGAFAPFPMSPLIWLGGLGLSVGQRAYDQSELGVGEPVRRIARRIARLSVGLTIVMIIDDLDGLDVSIASDFVRNLIARPNGQVLVVGAASPESEIAEALLSADAYDPLAEQIFKVEDASGEMGELERRRVVDEAFADLPAVARDRLVYGSRSFGDIYAVSSTPGVGDLVEITDEKELLERLDQMITTCVSKPNVSTRALTCLWTGGALHRDQWNQVASVLKRNHADTDDLSGTTELGPVLRIAVPITEDLKWRSRDAFDRTIRQQLAPIIVRVAAGLCSNDDVADFDLLIALQAAHHVRDDAEDEPLLAVAQLALILALERMNDSGGALKIAREALDGRPEHRQDLDNIRAAYVRLRLSVDRAHNDPHVDALIERALADGALVGLEARLWAAIDLLARTDRRDDAIRLTENIATELDKLDTASATVNHWRMLLAVHAGITGLGAFTQQLLAPLLADTAPREVADIADIAEQILYAVAGPHADTRLSIVVLENQLKVVLENQRKGIPESDDEDRLRIIDALTDAHLRLGEYPQALPYARETVTLRELLRGADDRQTLRARSRVAGLTGTCGNPREARRLLNELLPDEVRVLKADHPDTLATRHNIAFWTGRCGDSREALRLFKELLPDLIRVFGPDHPNPLATRSNVAFWTSGCGDSREALRLAKELLPDLVRVLGPDHHDTLATRSNAASFSGGCGDSREALRLFNELLPDQVRVFGPDHPDTLGTRNNIAMLTGECGDSREALRLFKELLPGLVRVLGPDHPDTLGTRNNVAMWTGERGDSREALRLFNELLPDQVRVLGPDHPDTLTTRNNIATLTGECGDSREALRLFNDLLPERVRVLGADHPDTLATRNNIAMLTGECGNSREALRLFNDLLPDLVRLLGADQPATLVTRNNVAFWTGECGDSREALRLFNELLPERVRVLGADHPDTLATRNNIAFLTGECGDSREALRLFNELLPERVRVLGADHPDTLATRNNIAVYEAPDP